MFTKTSTRVLRAKALQSGSAITRPSVSLSSHAWRLATPVPHKPTVAVPSCDSYYSYLQQVMSTTTPQQQQSRMFSAAPDMERQETDLKNLDATVLEKIKKDFEAVDENRDGLMQPDEFRKLLQMHKRAFTEYEIDILTECFYSGTGARGVSFDRFLEALDLAANMSSDDKEAEAVGKKLNIDARGAEYILGSKTHAYTAEELDISLTHRPPEGFTNKLSFQAVKGVRFLFDLGTGWNGTITTHKVMNRVIYLETIAAVPGMVAGVMRHFKSLRAMERDGGMLNMFLEEALNERMHLLTFIKMKNPGLVLRGAVLVGQLGFATFYGLAYAISPKFCHTFVGYVEEEVSW